MIKVNQFKSNQGPHENTLQKTKYNKHNHTLKPYQRNKAPQTENTTSRMHFELCFICMFFQLPSYFELC